MAVVQFQRPAGRRRVAAPEGGLGDVFNGLLNALETNQRVLAHWRAAITGRNFGTVGWGRSRAAKLTSLTNLADTVASMRADIIILQQWTEQVLLDATNGVAD